jgi:WD40 repeat protein
MIFSLVQDFAAALAAMPDSHPRRRILALLEEALRRDIHVLDRHPTSLFQCLWNSCWWYDLPESAEHYDVSKLTPGQTLPWEESGERLLAVVGGWREEKERLRTLGPWLRSLRPPPVPLGGVQGTVLRGHRGQVTSLAYSPDGRQLASSSSDQTVRIWDVATAQEVLTLRGHDGAVASVVYSPDGRLIASGGDWQDATLRLWDAVTGEERGLLRWHKGNVENIVFSSDGRLIASTGRDEPVVHLWDVATGTERARLTGHERPPSSIAFAPDGHRLASGSEDGTIRVWDTITGHELAVLRGERNFGCLKFLTDGNVVRSNAPSVIEIDSTREAAIRQAHEGSAYCVAFAPDGESLATGADDGVIRVWQARAGPVPPPLRGHARTVTAAAFSSNGRWFASASTDGTARLWDTASGYEARVLQGHDHQVWGVAFSPDGRRLATASFDRTVRIWDAATGGELAILRGHAGAVMTVSYSADGRSVFSGSREDGSVRVWDTATWECRRVVPGAYDAPEVDAPRPQVPIYASVYSAETVILREIEDPLHDSGDSSGRTIAWFPVMFRKLYQHPSGRLWASFVYTNLYLFEVEEFSP